MTQNPASIEPGMRRKSRASNGAHPDSSLPLPEQLRALRTSLDALRESDAHYRDLFENAPNAYLIIDAEGRIERANRRVTEFLGYSDRELVGAVFHAFMADTPAGKIRGLEASRKHRAGKSVAGWDIELRHKDGRPLWIKMWLEPIRSADGPVTTGRIFFVDITERVLTDQRSRLQAQTMYLQEEIKAHYDFEQIVGRSPALMEVLGKVRRVAPTDASVLITGETGTGKELIARAIHFASRRRGKPLIKVNCAALPSGLVESELFGHEKGAFTGASDKRLGRFELADGGTLFLDEIGEIPWEVQPTLLRVLQEHEFDRVGGTAPVKVDVRVIAATNRTLLPMIQEKTFREDLYFRLNVFPVHLPTLCERRDDIPLLVQFLVHKFAQQIGKHFDGVTDATLQRLVHYSWPGNIRELENVLERAVILATGPVLDISPDLFAAPAAVLTRGMGQEAEEENDTHSSHGSDPSPLVGGLAAVEPQLTLEAVERAHILTVLRQTNWVVSGPRGAAKVLGLHPNTLGNRMKKLGISRIAHQVR
jgi:PAS domain S-box-containing protein